MGILADAMPEKAAIPRSTDGMADIQSLLRLLAEQVMNAIMDEEADQLCGDGATVSVNLFFISFAKQARRSRKGGFTGCANVFSPIPVTA